MIMTMGCIKISPNVYQYIATAAVGLQAQMALSKTKNPNSNRTQFYPLPSKYLLTGRGLYLVQNMQSPRP
jgi:hypothetical protein